MKRTVIICVAAIGIILTVYCGGMYLFSGTGLFWDIRDTAEQIDRDNMSERSSVKQTLEECVIQVIYREEMDFNNNQKIPDYYKDHLKEKVSLINRNKRRNDGSARFVFITDVHFNTYSQAFHSNELLKFVCKYTGIKDIFNGGDAATREFRNPLDKENFIQQMQNGLTYCTPNIDGNTWYIAGNHDTGWEYDGKGGSVPNVISSDELYEISGIESKKELIQQDPNCGFNYTYTDDKHMIYYVICTANLRDVVTGESYTDFYMWFANALKECPSGYTVIVFNHEIIHSVQKGVIGFIQELFDVMDAYNARKASEIYANEPGTVVDFSTCEGQIACMIGGHAHLDWDTSTPGGIPVVVTTTDNYGGESVSEGIPNRRTDARGTIEEQAFDVFTINTREKQIKATRIGAGEDRVFNY